MELEQDKKLKNEQAYLQNEREAGVWKKRIEADEKYYKAWEDKFQCSKIEDYIEGFQWEGEPEEYKAYVINLFFSSIETKVPSLLFQRPSFTVSPRPYEADFDQAGAYDKARLKQDAINSFIDCNKHKAAEEFNEALYDTFSRFGIIECYYSGNWFENPEAGKPVIDYTSEETDLDKIEAKSGPRLPDEERVYLKAIDPKTFRVGGTDNRYLERCDRVGYFELFHPEDIHKTKGLTNLDKLKKKTLWGDGLSDNRDNSLLKLWHYWDNREKIRYLVDDETGYVLKRVKFKWLPLKAYTPIRRRKSRSFYPVPLAFNWFSPQDEQNDTREALRAHRRKFKRHYIMRPGSMEEAEVAKIINGGDGSISTSNDPEIDKILWPVPTAPMDSASGNALAISKDDFNIISATSSEMRGEADRTTATQANIINQRTGIREDAERVKFANFLCECADLILKAHTKIVNPLWIKRFSDSEETMFTEIQMHSHTWESILSEELEGDDYNIEINITSLSPISNDQEKRKLFELLAVISQYPELAASPYMIREVMDRIGYRNEKVAQQLMQMATMKMMGVIELMSGQVAGMAQQNVAASTPNQQEQTQNQITNAGRIQ